MSVDRERTWSDGSSSDVPFGKSRRTARSPTPKRKEPDNESNSENLILKMLNEIQKDMKEMKEENRSLKQEIQHLRKENEELKKEVKNSNESMRTAAEDLKEFQRRLREEKDEWKKDKNELKERIQYLEGREEQREKLQRKNNIIIRGKKFEGKALIHEVQKFIETDLEIKLEIGDAYSYTMRNGRMATVAKLLKWEDKMQVVKNKCKLRGSDIYIDHDLTKREREVQKKLQELAAEERKKGERTQIGYKKIKIGSNCYAWDEKEAKLKSEALKF